MSNRKNTYTGQIEFARQKIKTFKHQLLYLSLGRLLFFIIIFGAPVLLWSYSQLLAVVIIILPLIIFLVLLKQFQKVSFLKQYHENKKKIFELEIEALSHHYKQFDEGAEFVDPTHFNSYDLDIFGRGSLFQFLNRTVTPSGKQTLAKMLMRPILEPKQIENRQKIITELAEDLSWRVKFAALGKMYSEKENENELFESWSKDDFHLKTKKITLFLLFILPAIAVLSLLYWIFTGISALFIFSGIIQFCFWLVEKKNISRIYQSFGKRIDILKKYTHLLRLIECKNWISDEGNEISKQLKENGLPSVEIRKLSRIVDAFDNRNNIIGIVLNVVIAWDLMCSYRIIKWHNRNKTHLPEWSYALSFIDALNSLSNFTYNYQENSFPRPVNSDFFIEAEQMGHPLLHADKRINNNFSFSPENNVIIITGANMAGKSTFLRTVGVNMLLAMCGAPVCAQRMHFKPAEVFSNMRTTDSLFDDESYFFAELKRLQTILVEIEHGREMLIILDEILKGTNSVDKLLGSQKLIQKLIAKNCKAIIATHDLKLTELETNFPDKIKNQCFEIEIDKDEMHFDYTLRNGVTNTMNATFLMKKMEIID